MNKQEILDLLEKLGMIEESDRDIDFTDTVETICFVESLTATNDLPTIEKFLFCLLAGLE